MHATEKHNRRRASDIRNAASRLRDVRIALWLKANRLDGSMFAFVA